VTVEHGKEAYFALMAKDMLDLAKKYSKDVDEIHKVFYQVSCNREKLVKHLSGDKNAALWTELEDLALKEHGQMYNHVLKTRGATEVERENVS